MEMENRLSRSSARGRKLSTKEGRKNQTGCLFSMSFKEPSHQRSCTLLLLSQFTPSHAHVHTYYFTLKHTSRMHFLPILMCFFFPWIFVVSFPQRWITFSALHRHCAINPLNSSPLPRSPLPLPFCLSVYDSVITLSSLRWPIILGSSGVMQRVLN